MMVWSLRSTKTNSCTVGGVSSSATVVAEMPKNSSTTLIPPVSLTRSRVKMTAVLFRDRPMFRNFS